MLIGAPYPSQVGGPFALTGLRIVVAILAASAWAGLEGFSLSLAGVACRTWFQELLASAVVCDLQLSSFEGLMLLP